MVTKYREEGLTEILKNCHIHPNERFEECRVFPIGFERTNVVCTLPGLCWLVLTKDKAFWSRMTLRVDGFNFYGHEAEAWVKRHAPMTYADARRVINDLEETKKPNQDSGIFEHQCMSPDCPRIVENDNEPCCPSHSPDSGAALVGFSARRLAEHCGS